MKQDKYLLNVATIESLPLQSRRVMDFLRARARRVEDATRDLSDPNISVVIRTRNDIKYIGSLLDDIEAQIFSGKIEIILVDTESSDGTAELAKKRGARVINIRQKNFNYPKSLNIGYEAAKYPYVASLSGHSNLGSRYFFKSLTYWAERPKFGGLYCTPLINQNASFVERWASATGITHRFKEAEVISKPHMGFLSATGSIVSKKVWRELGGYDERYANGGEDTELGRKMLEYGYMVVREPLLTVLHSHGLGLFNSLKQFAHWYQIYKNPLPFDQNGILKRRPDLD